MKGFEHKYTLSTVYLIERSLFGCFSKRSGLEYSCLLYTGWRSVIQSPFSYILVTFQLTEWQSFILFLISLIAVQEIWEAYLGEGEQRSFDRCKCASYDMCKSDRICFFIDRFCVFDVFALKNLKATNQTYEPCVLPLFYLRFYEMYDISIWIPDIYELSKRRDIVMISPRINILYM